MGKFYLSEFIWKYKIQNNYKSKNYSIDHNSLALLNF